MNIYKHEPEYYKALSQAILDQETVSDELKELLELYISWWDYYWLLEKQEHIKALFEWIFDRNSLNKLRQEYLNLARKITKDNKSEISAKSKQLIQENNSKIYENDKVLEVITYLDNNNYIIENESIFEWLTERERYLICLFAMRQDCETTSFYIQYYWIKDQEMLFQIAMEAAKLNWEIITSTIIYYWIRNESKLFAIAMEAARSNWNFTSHFIKSYWIKDKDRLYQIALEVAKKDWYWISLHIANYDIFDKDKLYQIALAAANNSGYWVSVYISRYWIEDKEKLYQIALISMKENTNHTAQNIQNFKITDQEKIFQLALIWVKYDPKSISENIKEFRIESGDHMFQIAKVIAKRDWYAISCNIDYFKISMGKLWGIEDENKLYEIAMIAANQNWPLTLKFIKRYWINNDDMLDEIMLMCLRNSTESLKYINKYRSRIPTIDDDLLNWNSFRSYLYELAKVWLISYEHIGIIYAENMRIDNLWFMLSIILKKNIKSESYEKLSFARR